MTDDQQRARELRKQAAEILAAAYKDAHFFGAMDDALSETPSPHCQVTITAITAALRAAPEWQPMETAPKDVRILALFADGGVGIVQWDAQRHNARPRPYWEDDRRWLGIGYMREKPPVEWMPLTPAFARPQGEKDA